MGHSVNSEPPRVIFEDYFPQRGLSDLDWAALADFPEVGSHEVGLAYEPGVP